MSSIVDNIVQAVAAKFRAQGNNVKVTQLTSDWGLAESNFQELLNGSIFLGLNEFQQSFGNRMLFAHKADPGEPFANLEVAGTWKWTTLSIESLLVKDDEPFSKQEHSELIAQTQLHMGQNVVAFKLWRPIPHLALEFSDGSVFVIHGNTGEYESWNFETSRDTIGVYAVSGGPIAVG